MDLTFYRGTACVNFIRYSRKSTCFFVCDSRSPCSKSDCPCCRSGFNSPVLPPKKRSSMLTSELLESAGLPPPLPPRQSTVLPSDFPVSPGGDTPPPPRQSAVLPSDYSVGSSDASSESSSSDSRDSDVPPIPPKAPLSATNTKVSVAISSHCQLTSVNTLSIWT